MNLKHTLLAHSAFGGMTSNERRLGRFIRDAAGHPAPAPAAAPEPAPAPAAEEPAVDPFDAAFAEHAAGTPPAEEPPAPAATPPASVAEPAAGEPPAAETPPAPGETTPAATPPAGEEPPAPLSAEDVLRQLSEKLNQPSPAPAASAPAAEQQQEAPPAYNEAELAQLTEYEKNWPDVAAAETLKRRSEYRDLMMYMFGEVHKVVAPLREQMVMMGNTLHTGELKSLVPDYTPLVEADVNAWIDTQPSYLQAGMKGVMQGGTSEEVADLIGRYRVANGVTPAPTAAAPAATPAVPAAPVATPKTELSSAAKQAAESLAPVGGDRSAVPQGEDRQDFDTAFAKYAAGPVG